MMWQGILGHDEIVERFRLSLERGRLASTFLFVGPSGIGKRTFALRLAQSLLCQVNPESALDPCGVCDSCVQIAAGVHPDLLLVSKPADKSFIPLSCFLGDEQRRLREGLCHDIALKPFMGGRKIALIDDADYLNEEGANALLKTLEEPPPRSVLILIGTSADKQLPTIRSRSQIIAFRPLTEDIVAELLVSQGFVADPTEARRLALFSDGSLDRAVELADPELWQFRQDLLAQLAKPRFDSVQLARRTNEFVEAAGKEAAARRNRTRQVIRFAIDFFRQRLRVATGLPPVGDADLCRAAMSATEDCDPEQMAALADRSLDALSHVDRNAHQATLIECWLDDLAAASLGRARARRSWAAERGRGRNSEFGKGNSERRIPVQPKFVGRLSYFGVPNSPFRIPNFLLTPPRRSTPGVGRRRGCGARRGKCPARCPAPAALAGSAPIRTCRSRLP